MSRDAGLPSRPPKHKDNDPNSAQGPPAAPANLTRTMAGCITSWSAGMEQRYGFTGEHALGQISHQLLRTAFPRKLLDIEATLASLHAWSGALIHRHCDGSSVVSVNQWRVRPDGEMRNWSITEVHSNLAADDKEMRDHLADTIEVLSHELSEPLTAIRGYVNGARRLLQTGWPDLASVRGAMTQASDQIERGAEVAHLLRELAVAVRDTD